MQSQHHDASHLAAFGREWIETWNSHDLERILAMYSEDSEMTTDKIVEQLLARKRQRIRAKVKVLVGAADL